MCAREAGREGVMMGSIWENLALGREGERVGGKQGGIRAGYSWFRSVRMIKYSSKMRSGSCDCNGVYAWRERERPYWGTRKRRTGSRVRSGIDDGDL